MEIANALAHVRVIVTAIATKVNHAVKMKQGATWVAPFFIRVGGKVVLYV